jgi:hypothetical protein
VDRLKRLGYKSDALELGTMVHAGLELVWRGLPVEGVCSLEDTASQATARGDSDGAELAGLAAEMVRGYVRRWPEPVGVLDVEQVFDLPVAGRRKTRHQGKFDAIREDSGALQLVEHKTASKIDGGYLAKLWSDAQITGYTLAAERLYHRPCRSVLYDVVIKPPFRQGKDESADVYQGRLRVAYSGQRIAGGLRRRAAESDLDWLARIAADGDPWDGFEREELIITEADQQRWLGDLDDVIDAIRASHRRGRWTHHTRACFDWNRECDYLPICRAGGRVECSGAEYEVSETEHSELAPV